jgi:hypothetical protein
VVDRSARLTDPAELVVYLAVQAAALTWNFTINAAVVGGLAARGHGDWLWAFVALGIVTDVAALALFLGLRWLLAKAGRGQQRALIDLREIGAYLLAQAAGFVLATLVMTFVLASLHRSGVGHLAAVSLALNVVWILVVLLLFLFLRRLMAAGVGQGSRGGAARFGFGLAFAAWVVVALTIGSDKGMFPGTSVTERLPWLFDVCVAASLAAWAGGSAAFALTGFLRSRPWRAASMTIVAPCLAVPAAAVLVMGMWYGACAGQATVGWAIRMGAERTAHAVIAGGLPVGAACLLVTLLWSLYCLRPPR